MEQRLYTVHIQDGSEPRFIDDAFSVMALIVPPIWAAWNGLWITLGVVLVLSVSAALINPLAASPVNFGLGLILALEGGAIARWELRFLGWREAGVVEAATEEGAEERFLTGHAV
jgi:hypothetical protein